MDIGNIASYKQLSQQQLKFIRSLRHKKYRQLEQAFVVEGTKNVMALLNADYAVQMILGTEDFIKMHKDALQKYEGIAFTASATTLASLGTLKANNAALAVALIPAEQPLPVDLQERALVLEDIRDPGNLGTIIRIADWYGIYSLICSKSTVELYNPKVLQASMGSFVRVSMYSTDLPTYLQQASRPVIGAFTQGENVHHTTLPTPSFLVIGNEAHGISQAIAPYIQQRIAIPRYGQAESLNAAIATAILCDHWRKQHA